MKRLAVVAALLACSHSSGTKTAAATPASGNTTSAPAPAPAPAPPAGKLSPAGERAQALREAADQLDKAGTALANGNKNLAEMLFSSAELIVGPDAVAQIAPLFREGAPPRVTAPTQKIDPHAAPQPRTLGSSEAEDAEAKVAPPRIEGSLSGVIQVSGKPLTGAFGLVTVEPASGRWPARTPKRRVVEQRNREFLPHVLAVPVGSTVSFPNFDGVFHNVFSTSPLAAFDLGIYKMGEAREFVFPKEGIIRLGCNLHANMSAYVVVVAAPAYVVTDDAGAFAFKHLPPGKYKLKAWSERSKAPRELDVTIKTGANEPLTVDVAADAAPATDKFGAKRGG